MSLLSFIDRFSFKQILSAAILLAILFAVPTTVWLVNQQTKLYSSAHKENLPAGYFVEEEPFGQASANPPEITSISPFLGKVDDVVLIYGHDFGQNPEDRAIYFGSVKADPKDILKWHDNEINVMVPEGAQSGQITVVEVDKSDTYSLPFTVYDRNTQVRVFWEANNLSMEKGFEVAKARVILASGQEENREIKDPGTITVIWDNIPSKDISYISLQDAAGNPVSFYVNPLEFGF